MGLEERLYYQTDASMNVTALVNPSGTVVERYTYSPHGNVTRYSGAWASQSETTYRNGVLFASYWRDRDTGLLLARRQRCWLTATRRPVFAAQLRPV